MKISVISHP